MSRAFLLSNLSSENTGSPTAARGTSSQPFSVRSVSSVARMCFMKVMKFGGTSMGNADAIQRCAAIVEREIKASGAKPVIVVSAYSKVTDLLLTAAKNAVQGNVDESFAPVAIMFPARSARF